ncbi:MAG: rhodanese-like domain-containing protein [Hydrogenophilaceae bacterium]|jgi:rhodanese-related sulfurtransferase|nr:rhodanese-like domain-containing protein [Hydrogenophilaceae bacterium]
MFGVREIDPNQLEELKAHGNLQLIDVRTEAEFAQAKIEGSTHIPLHMLPLKVQELQTQNPIVFYCRSGARSAQACAWLMSQGINNVYNLSGGIMNWARSGKALAA